MSAQFPLDLLVDHVEGLLDETTAARIEEQRGRDSDLDNTLQGISLFLQDHAYDRSALEQWLKDSSKPPLSSISHERKGSAAFFSSRARVLLVAAAILAMVAMLWIGQRSDPQDFLLSQSQVHYSLPNYRSAAEAVAAEGLQAYEQREYGKAIQLLSAVPEQEQTALTLFIVGLSSFHLNDHEAAISKLRSDLVQHSRLADQANWYSALAAWHLADCEAARSYFDEVQSTANGQDLDKARRSLRESATCAH